ncbi:MAG: hypothetical protein ACI9L6_000224 [Flavobacterium sp.]
MSPEAKRVMQQFLKYSFIGISYEIEDALNQFNDDTQIDELMVVSHIYNHVARLNSYEILKGLRSATKKS